MLGVALLLAACGRRGPLEPPPGAANAPDVTPEATSVENQSTPGSAPITIKPVGERKAKGTPITAPKKKFFLDPLL
jgi:predicted small lipoprotein YifL